MINLPTEQITLVIIATTSTFSPPPPPGRSVESPALSVTPLAHAANGVTDTAFYFIHQFTGTF